MSYFQLESSTKFKPFLKKIQGEDYCPEDRSLMAVPEIILTVHHQLPGKKLTDYKYCLVKWKDQEYNQSTWELIDDVKTKAPDTGTKALSTYLSIQRTQHIA